VRDGRVKGNVFENVVCRAISTWIVPGDWSTCPVFALPFRRRFTDTTSLEGHWEGGGDILHRPDIEFPFAVECKDREEWGDLDQMVHNPAWKVWDYWDQARAQARLVGLRPILVFKRARRPANALLEQEVAQWLHLAPKDGPVLTVVRAESEPVVVALLDDLVRTSRSRVLSLAKPGR